MISIRGEDARSTRRWPQKSQTDVIALISNRKFSFSRHPPEMCNHAIMRFGGERQTLLFFGNKNVRLLLAVNGMQKTFAFRGGLTVILLDKTCRAIGPLFTQRHGTGWLSAGTRRLFDHNAASDRQDRRIGPAAHGLKHDDASSNRHHASGFCFRRIFAENRFATPASR